MDISRFFPPVDPSATKLTPEEQERRVRELRSKMEQASEATLKGSPTLQMRREIQESAAEQVAQELGLIGASPLELDNLAADFDAALRANRAGFVTALARPALDVASVPVHTPAEILAPALRSEAPAAEPEFDPLGLATAEAEAQAAMTPAERWSAYQKAKAKAKKSEGTGAAGRVTVEDPDIKRTYYDVEFAKDSLGNPVVRYVLYTPRRAGYVIKERRKLGRTIVRPETGFVRSRNKQYKISPKTPRQPGGDTYLKPNVRLQALEQARNEAARTGDFQAEVDYRTQIAAIKQEAQDYAAKMAYETNKPVEAGTGESINAAKKVALFSLPKTSMQSVEDILGLSEVAGAATEDHAWLEDKKFSRMMRGLSMKARFRGERVADPRAGYAKFVTTSPLLAYYTIMLWNTPELFTGFSIMLPAVQTVGGVQESDVINIPPVTDPRNVHHSPFFGYYQALAVEVMMQGALAKAALEGNARDAARLYLNLYGSSDVRSSADRGLRNALNKMSASIRPLSQRPSADDRAELKRLKEDAEALRSDIERNRIPKDEIPEERARLKELLAQVQTAEAGHDLSATPLAQILTSARRPSPAQNAVAEAWEIVSGWLRQIGPAERKLLENPAYGRSRFR